MRADPGKEDLQLLLRRRDALLDKPPSPSRDALVAALQALIDDLERDVEKG